MQSSNENKDSIFKGTTHDSSDEESSIARSTGLGGIFLSQYSALKNEAPRPAHVGVTRSNSSSSAWQGQHEKHVALLNDDDRNCERKLLPTFRTKSNSVAATPHSLSAVLSDKEDESSDDEWINSLGRQTSRIRSKPSTQVRASSIATSSDDDINTDWAKSVHTQQRKIKSDISDIVANGKRKRKRTRTTLNESRHTVPFGKKKAADDEHDQESPWSDEEVLADKKQLISTKFNAPVDGNYGNGEDEDYPIFADEPTSDHSRIHLGMCRDISGCVPASIARYLRPYQIEGVQWLWKKYSSSKKTGAILGDDMGLGKTVQVIAFLAAVLEKKGSNADKATVRRKQRGEVMIEAEHSRHWQQMAGERQVLIICPSSVLMQWHEHLQRWAHFSIAVLQGNHELKAQAMERTKNGRVEVLLSSYDAMRRHEQSLQEIHWEVVVFDEFHVLKNPKSASTRSARTMVAEFRIGLTGTPIQNNLEELWCLLSVVSPRRFLDMKEWKAHFSNPIKRAQKKSASDEAVARGRERQKELQKLLHSHMLRRTKAVIEHELKGKDDIIVFCELSPLQMMIYKHLLSLPDFRNARFHRKTKNCRCSPQPCKHRVPLLPDGSALDERAVLWLRTHEDHEAGCTRCPTCVIFSCMAVLQKVANHPFLLQVDELDPNTEKREFMHEFVTKALGPEILHELGGPIRSQRFTEISKANVSGKMETLTKLLKRFHSRGDKVLLFSFSTQMLDLLQTYIKAKGYSHLRLDGRTPTARRQQLIDEFNSTKGIFIFLISTRAGGLGLNLTSANKVIVFDVNWNPSYDMQAQDRAFRIGQERHVQVFRLVSQGTVEELCYMRQVYKLQLTRAAMEKGAQGATPRHFEGVQGEEHGELFGVENLMQFLDGSILKAIRSSVAMTPAPITVAAATEDEENEEKQANIAEIMEKAVGKALEDVKQQQQQKEGRGKKNDDEEAMDSQILEDPAALLAALGVMGTNMAADELLNGPPSSSSAMNKQQHHVNALESDDEPEVIIDPTPTSSSSLPASMEMTIQQQQQQQQQQNSQEPSPTTAEFLRSLEALNAHNPSDDKKVMSAHPHHHEREHEGNDGEKKEERHVSKRKISDLFQGHHTNTHKKRATEQSKRKHQHPQTITLPVKPQVYIPNYLRQVAK